MTLAVGQGYTSQVCAGDLATIAVGFPVYTNVDGSIDLAIELRDSATKELIETAIYPTHYTFARTAAPGVGGVITPLSAAVFAAGRTAYVVRNTKLHQESKFGELVKFPGETTEVSLDRLTAAAQDHGRDLSRALKLRLGTSLASGAIFEIDGQSIELAELGADAILSPGWRAILRTPRTEYSAEAYRQSGDDDTTAAQRAADACDAAGGGRLYFPAKSGGWIFKRSVTLGSNTWAYGDGDATVIKAHQTAFEGTAAENDCYLFCNKNWDADELTDHDIVVSDLKVDYGAVTISGGGAHAICLRYVERALVENVTSNSGDNCTAFLACRDFWTVNSVAYYPRNCGFDQWMGSGEAHVLNCTVYGLVGTTAQGIQLTGTGTFNEDLYSEDIKISGCSVYDVRSNGQSSGIILNANDAGSGVRNGLIQGNTAVGCDNGIVAAGNGGGHMIKNNKIRDTVATGILVQEEGSTGSGRVPSDCVITGNDFNDCDTDVASPGLISVGGGAGHFIAHNRGNSGDYAYWLWFAAGVTNSLAIDNTIPDGTTGSVLDQGTGNRVRAISSVFPALGDYGRITGLVATDASIAIAGAEASGKLIRVPEGDHKTTAIATGASLNGRYDGDGQIVTNDNNKRAKRFTAIKAAPSSFGNWSSPDTAFNGDLRHTQTHEHRISGVATLGQPDEGGGGESENYTIRFEAARQNTYTFISGESGWNDGTATNAGRTGAGDSYIHLFHRGNGDAFARWANVFVDGQRSAMPDGLSATHFIASPAGSQLAGQTLAGRNGVFLQGIGDINLADQGYDVAGAGHNINLTRTNETGAIEADWFGYRVQSVGSKAAGASYSAVGKYRIGLHLNGMTLGTTAAAAALAADQRIYMNCTTADLFNLPRNVALGDEFFEYSSVGFFNWVKDGVSVGQLNDYWFYTPGRVNGVLGLQVGGVDVVDSARGHLFRSYTDTQLNDVTHAVNTVGPVAGKTVWNSDQLRLVTKTGATAGAVWASEGATRNTPV